MSDQTARFSPPDDAFTAARDAFTAKSLAKAVGRR
jgi:hypothetical protein